MLYRVTNMTVTQLFSAIDAVNRRIPEQLETRPVPKKVPYKQVVRPKIQEPPKQIQTKEKEFVKDAVTEAPKKEEQVKKDVTPVAKAPSPDKACVGHYELNNLMTTVLDAELDDIMPKVREELSREISSQKTLFVDETVHKNLAEDLRNVLGLNISKRLLNVFNSLYVKIKFHGKPRKEDLREFLKKYHFTAFARKSVNIFAAKLRAIEDFDKLFSTNEVRCGPVKMTISPVYSFATCPKNLITKYQITDTEEAEGIAIDKEKTAMTYDKNTTAIKTSIKKSESDTHKKSSEIVTSNTVTTSKVTSQNVVTQKVSTVGDIKSNQNNKTDNKTTTQKKEIVSQSHITPQKTAAISDSKTMGENKSSLKSTLIQTETAQKPVAETKKPENSSKPDITAVTLQKSTKTTMTTLKSKNTALTSRKSTKAALTTQKPAKHVTTKKSTYNDFDEMDDHDILALISEGIVLDECGSEED